MKAKLIPAESSQNNITIYSFVGARNIICQQGYMSPIEVVYMNNGCIFLIDEEGKLKNLPMNIEATRMAHEQEAIYPSDFICGDVILIEDVAEFDELRYE